MAARTTESTGTPGPLPIPSEAVLRPSGAVSARLYQRAAQRPDRARASACAAGARAGGGAALGITAESAAALGGVSPRKPLVGKGLVEIVDSETGEIFTAKRAHDCSLHVVLSPQQQRARKWMRKAALVDILGRKHRVAACNRHPVKHAKAVEVWAKLDAYLPGHFVGLQTCALPWLCPICSPKIGERRAGEIQSAMAQCLAEGGQVLMPTFTIRHGRQQPLAETLDLIKQALRWMGNTRQYKQLQQRLKVEGRVIATEVTHGEANGWHPHFHELWFFRVGGVDVAELEEALYGLWLHACRRFGLDEPSRRHGVVVQDGAQAAKYVSKMGEKGWTLADEMAKANAKAGRQGNRSFWQLIDCAIDDEATPQHRNRAKRLIEEYEQATKGRRALVWTPGLKKRFAVAELTDEELAEQVEAEAVLIAEIPLDDWKVITRHRLESVVLDACLNGREAVFSIIEAFRDKGN